LLPPRLFGASGNADDVHETQPPHCVDMMRSDESRADNSHPQAFRCPIIHARDYSSKKQTARSECLRNGLLPGGRGTSRDVNDEPSRKFQVVGLSADGIEDATGPRWRLRQTESGDAHYVVSKIGPQTE